MSKTFTYALLVIGVYLFVVFPKTVSKESTKNDNKKEDKEKITEKKKDENGVTEGAGGRLKYGIGYTN